MQISTLQQENQTISNERKAWEEVYQKREAELEERMAQAATRLKDAEELAAARTAESNRLQSQADASAERVIELEAEVASLQTLVQRTQDQLNQTCKQREFEEQTTRNLHVGWEQLTADLEDAKEQANSAELLAVELDIVRQMKTQLESKVKTNYSLRLKAVAGRNDCR